MRIPNEPSGGAANVFSDLLRLQSEFHSRLAEETLRYFRRIQGSSVPAAPGTVMLPDGSIELTGSGAPGSAVNLEMEIENLQRVHCMAAPMLSPLVDQSGATWFPACDYSLPALVAPGEIATLKIEFPIPQQLPSGVYRGALLLQGFRAGAVPVAVSVTGETAAEPKASAGRKRAAASKQTRKTTSNSKTSSKRTTRTAKKGPAA
ncbi:MAG TPA: hypothetical protein VFA65_02455 [Bryobacteraceae bacterium]|nr:hypothetical protein [Bryobacteraceae bacterium]